KLGGKINVFLHITNNLTYSYDHDKNLADGQWHQVIGSYDGEIFKVYIDGENVRQNNQYGTGKAVRFDAPGFNLGGLPKEGLQRYFTGLLDEVMIYNRALSDQEVQILAHKGKVVADDDLENPILYLPFEQHDQNLSSCLFQSTEVEVSGGSFATSCSPVGGESMKLLNGNGDYLAGSSILEVPQFTLSFWMSTYSAKESFIAGWDTTGYRIKLNPKGSVGKLQVQLWVSKKEILTLSSSSENLNDGQCRHIAVSYDGQMCRLFIDGSMQDEKKVEAGKPGTTMGVFHAASTFLIGSERENNPQVGFQGKIDEIRLYNRALDKNEIKKLTIPQKPAPLQHRFYDSAGIGAQSTFLAASNFSSKPAKIEVQDANRKVLFSQKIKPGEHILKVFPVKLDRRSVKVFWE
ncbi:MAG: LamG domain-containing protein, partial [Saprospiraceae bacterium]|nr:LamG domain-containing protein [Saprospiraceae bacterium]